MNTCLAKLAPRLAAALLALTGSLSACSAQAPPATMPSAPNATGVRPPVVPEHGLTKGMVLPLEAYEETYPQAATVLRAQVLLESRCMSGFGFTFALPSTALAPVLDYDPSNMGRRYGLADLADAQASGYAVPLPPTPSLPALTADESRVLDGSPTPGTPPLPSADTYRGLRIPAEGCVGQAARALGVSDGEPLAVTLDHRSLAASMNQPTVAAALQRWSACMKSDGFTVADPLHAPLVAARQGAAAGSRLDRAVAVADVTCKQQTNLITIWFAAETSIQRGYIAGNLAQLQRQRDQLAAEVEHAAAIDSAPTP